MVLFIFSNSWRSLSSRVYAMVARSMLEQELLSSLSSFPGIKEVAIKSIGEVVQSMIFLLTSFVCSSSSVGDHSLL